MAAKSNIAFFMVCFYAKKIKKTLIVFYTLSIRANASKFLNNNFNKFTVCL